MPEIKDCAGQRFGRLLVLEAAGLDKYKNALWKCRCECGTVKIIKGSSLRSGASKSCGCLQKERASETFTTHGHSPLHRRPSRTYRSWQAMKSRCLNESHRAFPDYGGRGITVCERWVNSFENFLADMGECPPSLTLDRIQNAGNYEPGNCRWASRREQQRNMRSNRRLTYNGRTMCAADWAIELGMSDKTFRWRLANWGQTEKLFTEPLEFRRKRFEK